MIRTCRFSIRVLLTIGVAAACGGQTESDPSGAPTDAATVRQDGGVSVVDADADAVHVPCPPSLPAHDSPCDTGPAPNIVGVRFACEYGGDAFGRCTTIATCDVAAHVWSVPAEKCSTENPPACPTKFGAIADKAACPIDAPLGCEYDEGRCGCVCDGASKSIWMCRKRDDVLASDGSRTCPTKRPLLGTACAAEGLRCGYGFVCSPPTLDFGPEETCMGGVWVESGAIPCPARPRCSAWP